MPSPRHAAFVVAMAAVLTAACTANATRNDAARKPSPHFDLVNASFDSVTALAIAPAGSGDFRAIELGQPLPGGLGSATVDLPAGGCLRDFRVGFRGGRVLNLPAIDTCRQHGLRLTAK